LSDKIDAIMPMLSNDRELMLILIMFLWPLWLLKKSMLM
jgi:hypothetical protein